MSFSLSEPVALKEIKLLGGQKYAKIIPSKTFEKRHNDKGRNVKLLSLILRAVIRLGHPHKSLQADALHT